MKMDKRTAQKYLTPDALPVTHSHWSVMLGCFLHECVCCGDYFQSKKISGVKACSAKCRKRMSRSKV